MHHLVGLIPWATLGGLAWLAFAWLAAGAWALPILAGLHALDAWRAGRRRTAPFAPRARLPGLAAAQVLAALSLAVLLGYRPDWLVRAGLLASVLLRLADDSSTGPGAGLAADG